MFLLMESTYMVPRGTCMCVRSNSLCKMANDFEFILKLYVYEADRQMLSKVKNLFIKKGLNGEIHREVTSVCLSLCHTC